jgi:hypothetical protein
VSREGRFKWFHPYPFHYAKRGTEDVRADPAVDLLPLYRLYSPIKIYKQLAADLRVLASHGVGGWHLAVLIVVVRGAKK